MRFPPLAPAAVAAAALLSSCAARPEPVDPGLGETEVCLAALGYLLGGTDIDAGAVHSLSVTISSGEPAAETVAASREACRRSGLALREPGDLRYPRLVVRLERLGADRAEVRVGRATAPGAGRGSILLVRRRGDRIAIEPLSHWRM